MDRDPTWSKFGKRAARIGVHSALSTPLVAGDEVVAAINLYARTVDAFDERAEQLAALYAVPAAICMQTANDLANARALARQLETALASHAVIDHAIGILIARTGCTPEDGFTRLRATSQNENTRLTAVARKIVDQATQRARAYHRQA